MPLPRAEDYQDLEIRILALEDEGYPVEITFSGEQEFPRGYLTPDVVPWLALPSPGAEGERLFESLFADDRLKRAWAQARTTRATSSTQSGATTSPPAPRNNPRGSSR